MHIIHQLWIIDVVLVQAMLHIEYMLIQFFGIKKFCPVDSLPHF